jgi:hypothetical protein
MGPDMILPKKNSIFYVGVRYFKEGDLPKNTETVSLKINGVDAKLLNAKYNDTFTGSNVLFEAKPISSPGIYSVVFTVKTSQKSYSEESSIQIVDNYNLATIWDKLTHSYLSNVKSKTTLKTNGNFSVSGRANKEQTLPTATVFEIGSYRKNHPISGIETDVSNPFIEGLEGLYRVTFQNQILQEIKIIMGNTSVDPSINKNAIFSELNMLYGTPTITYPNVGTLRTYQNGIFDIMVTDASGDITATIRKVR